MHTVVIHTVVMHTVVNIVIRTHDGPEGHVCPYSMCTHYTVIMPVNAPPHRAYMLYIYVGLAPVGSDTVQLAAHYVS